MTRDYKNISESNVRVAKTKKKPAKAVKKAVKKTTRNTEESTGLPVWQWLVSGIVIVTFISFLVYLKLSEDVDKDVSKVVNADKSTSERSAEEKAVRLKEEKSRFEFYSILPKRNIEVPVEPNIGESVGKKDDLKKDVKKVVSTTKAVQKTAPAKNVVVKKPYSNRLYVLQVGSFNRFKDADKRKANLAFMGILSKIHATSRANKTMYRVQVGPYGSLTKINKIASTLKQNKIPSLLMKVKG